MALLSQKSKSQTGSYWPGQKNYLFAIKKVASRPCYWKNNQDSSFTTGFDFVFYSPLAPLISHQPAVLLSHNKPATSNQPAVLFSQNKPAPAISHQPTEQAANP
jgi:hypothetical protein